VHAVAGPGAAGLSTLGNVLAGAVRADAGSYVVRGREVAYGSPRDALADGIVLIPRERLILRGSRVIENVFIGAEPSWRARSRGRRLESLYAALSERAGVSVAPDAHTDTLRPAERLQLDVLRALAHQAELVAFDEPAAELPTGEAHEVHDLVRRLQDEGITVVYLSHPFDEALEVADTVSLLVDGEIVLSTPSSTATVESLIAALARHPLAVDVPAPGWLGPDAATVLSVRGLRRAGSVDDVSFDLRAGEILGVAGLPGSGRAAMARLVAGAENRDAGTVSVDGAEVRTARDAARHGIVAAQEPSRRRGPLSWRPGGDSVALAAVAKARPFASSPGAGSDDAALAALRPPRVLVADEPTRGAAHDDRQAIYELIQSLARDGTSVLLGSSDARELAALAHRVLVLRRGRVVEELESSRTSAEELLRALYGVSGR
jgi:ABC-type sugar transport system ATPase subunit